MIHNEADVICRRLGELEGVRSVTRGWPKRPEALPCIAVHKAADTPVVFAGDRAHIAQLEYDVRVFAVRSEQADTIAAAADTAMEDMGYTRTLCYDDDSQDVRMAVLRYRRYV